MRKRQAKSLAVGKKKTSDATHVLLKTDNGLVLGAWNKVESTEKENLSVGMTKSLVDGRKRIRGIIISLGEKLFHTLTRIDRAFAEPSDKIAS